MTIFTTEEIVAVVQGLYGRHVAEKVAERLNGPRVTFEKGEVAFVEDDQEYIRWGDVPGDNPNDYRKLSTQEAGATEMMCVVDSVIDTLGRSNDSTAIEAHRMLVSAYNKWLNERGEG